MFLYIWVGRVESNLLYTISSPCIHSTGRVESEKGPFPYRGIQPIQMQLGRGVKPSNRGSFEQAQI